MITITNDNIYSSDFSITNIRNPEHINIVNDDDIIGYLSNEIELGESVTLERLFDIIKTNESELNKLGFKAGDRIDLSDIYKINNNFIGGLEWEYQYATTVKN